MKYNKCRWIALATALLFLLPLAQPLAPAAKPQTIEVKDPNGGERLYGGDRFRISWIASTPEGGVKLELSTDGGESYPYSIATIMTSKGSYNWTIPLSLNTTAARIRATLVSSMLPPYEVWARDVSDANFTIIPKLVLRFTEVPSEVSGGSYFRLRWDMYDPDDHVAALKLQWRVKDNGSWGSWQDMGGFYNSMPPTQGGVWLAPPFYEEATLQYKIQALSSHATVLAENTTSEITLRSPIIILKKPNGGEVLVGGQPFEITWVTVNDPHDVVYGIDIYYSINGGSSWTMIASTDNDFSHTWNVPTSINSENVFIKLENSHLDGYVFASDISDGPCTIISDPNTVTVSLIDPNPYVPRGLIIGGGERYTIKWSTTGPRSQVREFKIYLSENNGTSWSNILNASSTASSITWTAPLIDTEQAKIKVELIKTDNTKKSSQSNNPFCIYTETPFNRAPVANAGPNQDVVEGTTVHLDGSRSRDPDGDALFYTWRQTEPEEYPVTLHNSHTARPYFTPNIRDYTVHFIFELEVWDGKEATTPSFDNISRVTIKVTPLPPTITNFSPPRAMAGMKIHIEGSNLMGAQVFINDVLAATVLTAPTPTELDPDHSFNFTLHAGIPHRPGHVKVKTNAGEDTHARAINIYPVPEFCYEWAFSFPNSGKGELSYPWAFWEDGNYKDTFGSDEVYINIWVCIGIPYWTPWDGWECLGYEVEQPIAPDPFAAIVYGVGYWYLARNGRCYGYSATALQIKNGVVRTTDLQPGVYHTPNLTLGGEVERRIDFMHGSQISSAQLAWIIENHIGNWGPDGMKMCVDMIRNSIADGTYGIVSIVDGTSGHAMVPYLVEDVDSTHTRIYVYDSNRPAFSKPETAVDAVLNWGFPDNYPPYIEINKSGTYWSWEFYMAGGDRWGGTQGMVFIPFRKVNDDRSLPLSVDGIMDWIFGSATTTIEDSEGRRLAIEENGTWTGGIPNATPIVLSEGREYGGMGYYLPQGNYTTHVKGIGDGSYNWAQLVDGNSSFALEGAGVKNGTRDTLRLSYDGDNPLQSRLSYKTTDSEKVYNATLVKKMGTEQRRPRERVYKIQNADLFSDSEAVINTTPDLNSLVFFNNGPHSFSFDVEFQGNVIMEETWNSSYRPTGLPNVTRKGITIGPYQTMVIRPSNWLNLMNSTVIIEGELIATAPDTPENLRAVASKDRITLSWSAPSRDGGSPITAYVVLRGPSAANMTLLTELGNVTSYIDANVKAGETYYYAVLARNSVGGSNATAPVSATVPKKPAAAPAGGGIPLWLIVLVVVILVLVGAGAAMMRRKPPAQPAQPAAAQPPYPAPPATPPPPAPPPAAPPSPPPPPASPPAEPPAPPAPPPPPPEPAPPPPAALPAAQGTPVSPAAPQGPQLPPPSPPPAGP
ncbi:MAG: PKD domain-containing protein [Thermoplasmata archaeon]